MDLGGETNHTLRKQYILDLWIQLRYLATRYSYVYCQVGQGIACRRSQDGTADEDAESELGD